MKNLIYIILALSLVSLIVNIVNNILTKKMNKNERYYKFDSGDGNQSYFSGSFVDSSDMSNKLHSVSSSNSSSDVSSSQQPSQIDASLLGSKIDY